MKQYGTSSKDALLPLMVRLYEEIRAIEMEHALWAGAEDYRPRIELFHDAVRAYTSGEVALHAHNSRLSIQRLSRDIEMLRAIIQNPLLKNPNTQRQAPGKDVVLRSNIAPQGVQGAGGSAADARAQARAARAELAHRYQHYAVMFTALLAEAADMNHHSQMEERDVIVEELENLKQGTKRLSTMNLRHLAAQIIDDPEIAAIIAGMMPDDVLAQSDAERRIKNTQTRMDQQQARLETAHISWLSHQRMMYEDGKQVVQQLMAHGLNLAGKFLQEAMQKGGAGQGRGF